MKFVVSYGRFYTVLLDDVVFRVLAVKHWLPIGVWWSEAPTSVISEGRHTFSGNWIGLRRSIGQYETYNK